MEVKTSFAAFSDGSDVIERTLDVTESSRTSADDIGAVYEIEKCVQWINSNGFLRVALQFPDELLPDAASVTRALSAQTDCKIFILGDTSYGSCCVDEVAGEHNSADSIIHYGRSCLSQTRVLPVLYVFTRLPIDVRTCCEKIREVITDTDTPLLLLYDVRYHYAANDVAKIMKQPYKNFSIPKLDITNNTGEEKTDSETKDEINETTEIRKLGRIIRIPKDKKIEDYTVIYIGEESTSLTTWIMNLNKCRFCTFNPVTGAAQIETLNVNKMLMKRYYMIERAKDANIVGILAGTLGVKDHLAVMDRLKRLIKTAGKKSYTFVVGKLNVAKLANFAEIDVYVLVACPENTLIDSSEFYRPVITPYELEIACNQAREWTGDYYTDFRELLPGASGYVEISEDHTERTDVSLVTGAVRTLGIDEQGITGAGGQIQQRDQILTVANTAGEFLSERSWQGLEEKLGQTPVTKAVEGMKGIAASYDTEPT